MMKFTDLGQPEPSIKPPLLYKDLQPSDWFVSSHHMFSDMLPHLRTSSGHVCPHDGELYDPAVFQDVEVALLTDVNLQYRKVD